MALRLLFIILTISVLFLFVQSELLEQDYDTEEYILCTHYRGGIPHLSPNGAPEELQMESYWKCKKSNYCFTVWLVDPDNKTNVKIMDQGCWQTASKDCEQEQCISNHKPPKLMNHTKFCCCSSDLCNSNFTDAYVEVPDDPEENKENIKPESSVNFIIYVVVGVIFVIFIIILLGILYLCWQRRPKKNDVENSQHQLPPPEEFNLDQLKLLNIIGQGRYGNVWRGAVEDQHFAVKVFPAHHRNYFLNELEMYKVSGENAALLKCYGGGEYAMSPAGPDFVLVLSLEQECLQDYLRGHVLDLPALGKMSLGIAKGLAHLHSDLGKPCIAHRDINTRNILVRHDLTCCICDLGLAVIPRRAENKAISEAGTLRYMAPEVLEGAVNLRDCESALKQIDVYALGLVLWELGTRCSDLQNAEPQPYAPPFYKEAGENPSLEQMQTMVSRRKARPLWPISWKDTSAARLLCETAEDCWDQDAEARLTTLCVVERLFELPSLKGRSLHPSRPPASPTSLINNNHLHDHQLDATVETLLSPSEENCKNSNQLAACKTPLQPYQGRNPCLERNLLSGSSDSLLIDKSSKHCGSSESQSLIPNEFLNFQTNHHSSSIRAVPIPYLQNAVYGIPKRQNAARDSPETTARSKFTWNKFINNILHYNKDLKSKPNSSKLINHKAPLLRETNSPRPSTLPLRPVKQDPTSCGVSQIKKRNNSVSLEQFSEMFSSTTDLSHLKDPSQRIKTPGDVPPSVRRTRGRAAADSSARFSLYDDRVMNGTKEWGSAPHLEPETVINNDGKDRDSVSSF